MSALDETIDGLDPCDPLDGSEHIPISQSGVTVLTTAQEIADLASGGSTVRWQMVTADTDTDISAGVVPIPLSNAGGSGSPFFDFLGGDPENLIFTEDGIYQVSIWVEANSTNPSGELTTDLNVFWNTFNHRFINTTFNSGWQQTMLRGCNRVGKYTGGAFWFAASGPPVSIVAANDGITLEAGIQGVPTTTWQVLAGFAGVLAVKLG